MGCDVHNEGKRSTKVLRLQSHNLRLLGDASKMDLETRKTVGNNIRRLRDLRGWQQTDLARHCSGTSQTAISKIERGAAGATTDTLADVARALGVESYVLLIPTDKLTIAQLKSLGAVVNSYVASSEDGQSQIRRVAEAEERYSKAG